MHIVLFIYTFMQGWGSGTFFLGSGSGSAEEKKRIRIRNSKWKKINIYYSSPPIRSFGFIQEFLWMEIFRQSIVVAWICCYRYRIRIRWKKVTEPDRDPAAQKSTDPTWSGSGSSSLHLCIFIFGPGNSETGKNAVSSDWGRLPLPLSRRPPSRHATLLI